MSHFTSCTLSIKDTDSLVNALVACGVPRDKIEVHKEPVALRDYCNKTTKYRWKDTKDERFKDGDVAHVVIRKGTLGGAHNDLGYFVSGDSSVELICDFARSGTADCFKDPETKKSISTKVWISSVRQEYAYNVAKKHYDIQGKKVHKVRDAGKLHLFVGA